MAQGDQGIEPGPARGEGGVLLESFRVSNGPAVPAYSLLKQEQLQLAQASFRNFEELMAQDEKPVASDL
jgi:hypothetical protein